MFSTQGMAGSGTGGNNFANIIGGLFGNAGKPYEDAADEMRNYLPQAQSYLNPFLQAGHGAIPQFQEWLKGMKDPSGFINNLMGKYEESPFAKFQQEQSMRSAQNMGSATGLTGSTPLTQFAQQNARDISSQDMNGWLQNVLGINTQYGQGQMGLMNQGMNAGNSLTSLMSDFMNNMGGLKFGQGAAENGQWGNLIGGIGKLFF